MFQYLPHRRRLCDEPCQVHPPAAPAALERKHPVDARQQLRPHIARPLSRPRGADNFAHQLWPGCLSPRHQLPAGLRRHQRPPRRVRRQYPNVALPMLARQRYLRRYPIQKFAGAQPQFNTSLLPEPVPRQRRQPIPDAHRQTSDAHNSATAAPAQLDPARQPARPHALKEKRNRTVCLGC